MPQRTCPRCHASGQDDKASFCARCGTKLPGTAEQEAQGRSDAQFEASRKKLGEFIVAGDCPQALSTVSAMLRLRPLATELLKIRTDLQDQLARAAAPARPRQSAAARPAMAPITRTADLDPRVQVLIDELVDEETGIVDWNVWEALEKFGTAAMQAAIPTLVAGLRAAEKYDHAQQFAPDQQIRLIFLCFERIGKAALPTLTALLSDSSKVVRKYAAMTLANLDAQKA